MKRILFLGAAFLLSATVLFAQGQQRGQRGERNPEKMIEKRVEKMTEDLSLTDAQATSLQQQWLANHQAREAELETTGNREARKEIVKKYRKQNQEVLKTVLTPDQFAKHEELTAERKKKMKEGRKARRGERGGGDF